MDNIQEQTRTRSLDAVAAEQQRFMVRVYNWMAAGLAVTGFMAYFVSQSPFLIGIIFGTPFVPLLLFAGQFGLVIYLTARIQKMSASQATGVFVFYSGLTGLTFSSIFLVYSGASIASTFAITAGTFGAMSLYGYTTKRDLTSLGGFLIMGLIGFFIATIVNIWLQNDMLHTVLTYIGLLVFIGLTAYDTQKIKETNILGNEGTDEDTKEAISGALHLYLDFINMFILMLRLFGGSRE